MKCSKCGAEFNGKSCPECGTPAGANQPSNLPVQPNAEQAVPSGKKKTFYMSAQIPPKKKRGFLKYGLIALGVIIVIAVAAQSCGGNPSNTASVPEESAASVQPSDSSSPASKTPSATENAYGVGQTANSNGIQMTLVGVTENNGSDYNKPTDGNVFLLCEFMIENDSQSDLSISSVMCFEAYVDGFSVNQSISGLIQKGDKQQLDGQVAAGKKMDGVIAYEVPKDWKEIEIHLNANVFSFFSGDTIFKASHS